MEQHGPGFHRTATRRSSAGSSAYESAPDSPVGGDARKHNRRGTRRLSQQLVNNDDIVQFSAPIYFVEEEEEEVTIDLMRMGSCQGECSVHYTTADGSGKGGQRFETTSGIVTFRDGENTSSIKVRIINSRMWSATLEFRVLLDHPTQCQLGLYLKACRVKVIDYDVFPSNSHIDDVSSGLEHIKQIRSATLLWDFLYLAFQVDGIAWRTAIVAVLDQSKNIYLYFTLTVSVYLADVLFNTDPQESPTVELLPGVPCGMFVEGNPGKSAALLGIMYFLPMFFMHALDDCKVLMDMRGIIGSWVRANLVRKYLNYAEESRAQVSQSHVQMAMLQEVAVLTEGYISVLRLIRQVGRIAVVLFFAYTATPDSTTIGILLLLPVLMCVWAACRMTVYVKAQEIQGEKQLEMVDFINEMCARYDLIAEYFQRPQINDLFEEKQGDLRSHSVPVDLIYMNNYCVQKAMGPLFTGLYIAIQSQAEIAGNISLGTFLTTSGLFNDVAKTFLKVYDLGLSVYAMILPLKSFTYYLNLPTDLPALKKMNRKRREVTKTERAKARERLAAMPESERLHSVAVDMIPIKLVNFGFSYNPKTVIFQDVNLEVAQGNMVAIISEYENIGRATLMKLLGQRLFPTEGLCFIPSHLRVLHVSATPTIMDRTIWDNLTFGARDASLDRVVKILEEMQLQEVALTVKSELDMLRLGMGASHEVTNMMTRLSAATIAKIHLARGLIMNPEVLVLQRPLSFYDQLSESRVHILNVMKEYVSNRGVALPRSEVGNRRPRTCFFTAETMEEAQEADVIWKILPDSRIQIDRGNIGSRVMAAPSTASVHEHLEEAMSARGMSRAGSDDMGPSYSTGAPVGDYMMDETEADNAEMRSRIRHMEATLAVLEKENRRFAETFPEPSYASGGVLSARGNSRAGSQATEPLLRENKRVAQLIEDEQLRCEELVHKITELRHRALKAEQEEKSHKEEGGRIRRQLWEMGVDRSKIGAWSVASASSVRMDNKSVYDAQSSHAGHPVDHHGPGQSGYAPLRPSSPSGGSPETPKGSSRVGTHELRQADEPAHAGSVAGSLPQGVVDTTDHPQEERNLVPRLRACRVCTT